MILTGNTRDDSQSTFLFGKRNCYNSASYNKCSSWSNLSKKSKMRKDSHVPTSTWIATNPRTWSIPCQCGVPGQWMNLTSLLMESGAPQFSSGKRREKPFPRVEEAKSFNCNQSKNVSLPVSNCFHSYQFLPGVPKMASLNAICSDNLHWRRRIRKCIKKAHRGAITYLGRDHLPPRPMMHSIVWSTRYVTHGFLNGVHLRGVFPWLTPHDCENISSN